MEKLIQQINELKKAKNACILVHNYQRPEIYQVADFIGDSLDLSRKAAATDADLILFCGVRFMAETAKILNPGKTVLLPTPDAECSLADMASVAKLRQVKKQHPEAAVVSYINTHADIKAESDVCCTSANAVSLVNALPQQEIIFLPDKNLGRYVQSKTDKKILMWDGYCAVHQDLDRQTLETFRDAYGECKIIAHPECQSEILDMADHVCGTGGMGKFAHDDNSQAYIVVTECGMTERLKEDVPDKNFIGFCNLCPFMKSTTLSLVYQSLQLEQHRINLPVETMDKARKAIDRMLAYA